MCSLPSIPIDSSSGGFCDPSLIGPDNALWPIYGWDQSDGDKQEPGVCGCVPTLTILANKMDIMNNEANICVPKVQSDLLEQYFKFYMRLVLLATIYFLLE